MWIDSGASSSSTAATARKVSTTSRVSGEYGQAHRDERARVRERAGEQGDAGGLVERAVGGADAGRGEHLVEGALVAARVLADVERGEVEAEDLDLARHVAERAVGDRLAPVGAEAPIHHREIGVELGARRGSGPGGFGGPAPPNVSGASR